MGNRILVWQFGVQQEEEEKTCVSSLIPSVRPTIPPVAITMLLEICFVSQNFEKWDGRTEGLTYGHKDRHHV